MCESTDAMCLDMTDCIAQDIRIHAAQQQMIYILYTENIKRNKAGIKAWNIGFSGRGACDLEETCLSLEDREGMQIRYFL